MATLSNLFATPTPTNSALPISDGSGAAGASLDAWVSNGSGGSGDIQAMLDTIGSTHGDILFRGATQWEVLPAGLDGQFLMTHGTGADPSWETVDVGNAIYDAWVVAVDSVGGTYETDSKAIARNLADALLSFSGYAKLKWLLPLIGANISAARVPLIDVLHAGPVTNVNFVDADFDQATGLQGDGTTKYFDSLIKPSQLGGTNNGGLGWWENNINLAGNVEPIGTYDATASFRYVLDLRSTLESFRWGNPSNSASTGSTAINAHYYGQRSSNILRELFRDGSSLATNTTSDGASGTADHTIIVVGADDQTSIAPWPGRCAVAYMTDGSLTSGQVAELHTLLNDFLITPTGR